MAAVRQWLLALCVALLLGTLGATWMMAQAVPAGTITAVDAKTGVVTARVNATGQQFQFKLSDPAQLNRVAVGQPIFVNLRARQVSLDGKSPAGIVVSVAPTRTAPLDGAAPLHGAKTTAAPVDGATPLDGARTTTAPVGSSSQSAVPTAVKSTSSAASSAPPHGPRGGVATTFKAQVVPINATRFAASLNVPNPNHLPDLVPSIPIGEVVCQVPPESTCQQSCPPVTTKVLLGIKNVSPYPANGAIHVLLQDVSGNIVRNWTINGLQGNGAAYPGNYQVQVYFCSAETSTMPGPSPNYTLKVSAPGITELDSTNNELHFYLTPGTPISP